MHATPTGSTIAIGASACACACIWARAAACTSATGTTGDGCRCPWCRHRCRQLHLHTTLAAHLTAPHAAHVHGGAQGARPRGVVGGLLITRRLLLVCGRPAIHYQRHVRANGRCRSLQVRQSVEYVPGARTCNGTGTPPTTTTTTTTTTITPIIIITVAVAPVFLILESLGQPRHGAQPRTCSRRSRRHCQ